MTKQKCINAAIQRYVTGMLNVYNELIVISDINHKVTDKFVVMINPLWTKSKDQLLVELDNLIRNKNQKR